MADPDELLYSKLFQLADDALLLLEGDDIILCNPACGQILRAPNAEAILQSKVKDLSPALQPDGQSSVVKSLELLNQVLQKGSMRFDWTHRRFDGKTFESEVFLRSFSHEGKDLVYAVIRDLTPWIDSQSALQTAENQLRLIAENSEDIIWMRDLKFRYTYLSPSVERVKGWTVEEAKKLTPFEVVPADDLKMAIAMLREELEQEKMPGIDPNRSRRFQVREYCKDGTLIWTEQSMSFFRDGDNKPIGFIGITRDITEQKKTLIELNKQKERAEESDRLKSAFLANMSHEIRTPLNAILGFSELIADEMTDLDERKQFSGIIKHSTKRLLAIITDIFDISKLEAQQMRIIPKPVNPAKIIDQVLTHFTENLDEEQKQKNSLKGYPVPAALHQDYMLDEPRIIQILSNLLDNSFKFTKNGQIGFGLVKSAEDRLRFFVRDTGLGIAPEKQELIFERFRQEDENLHRQFGGTGLGLAICKGLIDLMGGQIGVSSKPGEGSEFWFEIPIKHPS